MSASDWIFWSLGVTTAVVGGFAVTGLLAWRGIEWWIAFRDVRRPLMAFYADQLKKRNDRLPG